MPVKHPKVAVMLAAFNGMRWIEEQMASILNQAAVDVTVFISIDPSTDGTEGWCAELTARHPQVVVLPEVSRFGGASRNFFRLIRDVPLDEYEFFAFSDQDDIWDIDKLHRATLEIESRKVDGYSSNVTAFWANGRNCLIDKAQPQVDWDYLFESAGPGCTYVMTRRLMTLLKESVLFSWEELQRVSLHDWYCYAFARSHGFCWFIDPLSSLQYRQHERNQVGANAGLGSLIKRYKTIRNGWWFSQVKLIARLVGLDDDVFVQRWLPLERRHLLKLSLSAQHCRRRIRDKVFFFCICCAQAVIGRKAE
ncbi:glycosyltransferase [Pseudomonas frederiksbergensis]|uniref:Glycosyl transferase n=1 Tax=Pseudomonas frederiksbergensis TaxID=104087 RepID=A0A0B1Z997_9PSED|nr:glycosyltransferase [Pseudomonas frederiksbergensis]KHK65791.1 glycosyl transferase [Pseudomonas frederiksbergensis]